MQTRRIRIRSLRQEGRSLDDIAQRLGISRSTVYWHMRDLPLSLDQRATLHDRWKATMIRMNQRRRGIARSGPLQTKPRWSAELIHLLAHLQFDGRIDRWGCYYYNRSEAQLTHVVQLLQELFGVHPRIKWNSSGVGAVICHHVELAAQLQSRAETLVARVNGGPRTWRQVFLQAFFDDEGHVYLNGSKRRVRGAQKDVGLLQIIKRLLAQEGIKSRLDARASAIEIGGRQHLIRFQQRIGFSAGIRINPERKNARWHEPFEKRTILERALESYQSLL